MTKIISKAFAKLKGNPIQVKRPFNKSKHYSKVAMRVEGNMAYDDDAEIVDLAHRMALVSQLIDNEISLTNLDEEDTALIEDFKRSNPNRLDWRRSLNLMDDRYSELLAKGQQPMGSPGSL